MNKVRKRRVENFPFAFPAVTNLLWQKWTAIKKRKDGELLVDSRLEVILLFAENVDAASFENQNKRVINRSAYDELIPLLLTPRASCLAKTTAKITRINREIDDSRLPIRKTFLSS